MKAHAGSYEALFSRRAMKFRSMGLADKTLTEQDYRKLILEEYTFLKRPVFLTDAGVTAGSAKAQVAAARDLLSLPAPHHRGIHLSQAPRPAHG